MKSKFLIILSIPITFMLFSCSDYGYRQKVMDPDLIEFFGGLDLGMKSRYINKIDRGLKGYSESFFISYYGQSGNNPILDLSVSTDCGNLINPFLNRCWISRIHAEFRDDYLWSREIKSLDHWLTYFEGILQSPPIHYYDPERTYYKDIYLWHFKSYNLEIWCDKSLPINAQKAILFDIYLGGEQYPSISDMTEIFLVSQGGDTTKYSFLIPEINEIFDGFDIGMSITEVRNNTDEYTVDTEKDIYFVNSKNGDEIELYFFDYIYGKDPYFIEGNIYKIIKYADNNVDFNDPDIKVKIINEMLRQLDFEPRIFQCRNRYLNMEIYLWHFPLYNFEVRIKYSRNNKIQEILYLAYKDSDSIPNGEADKNLSIFDLDWEIEKQ